MDEKAKKRLIIWLSVGTILAVGGFFTVKHFKAKKAEKKRIEDEAAALVVSQSTNTGSTNTGSTSTGSAIDQPSDVKAFQDWMDKQGKPWILSNGKYVFLNKGNGYGSFGPATQQVWVVYKSQFLANPQSSSTTATASGILTKLNNYIADSKTGVAQNGKTYVTKKGSQGQYYWFDDRTFQMWVNDSARVAGVWSGDLAKTVTVTTGVNKGKTFTNENPLMAIYNSSIDANPPISTDMAALYAEMFLSSMQGAGTLDEKFWGTLGNIKNPVQWRQVFDKFGKKAGSNLDEWINSDLGEQLERSRWNEVASVKNIPLRLNTTSLSINQKTV